MIEPRYTVKDLLEAFPISETAMRGILRYLGYRRPKNFGKLLFSPRQVNRIVAQLTSIVVEPEREEVIERTPETEAERKRQRRQFLQRVHEKTLENLERQGN